MNKLYVRIWLAVVATVAVLTFLVGWAWRMAAEPPLREVVARNAAGEIIGQGRARIGRAPNPPAWSPEPGRQSPPDGEPDAQRPPRPAHWRGNASAPESGAPMGDGRGRLGGGPEFDVRMADGQLIHIHLPRRDGANWRAPFGFFWTLGLVAVAVALATYPIVRRLTRRLESLQHGVEQWGEGDLSARVSVTGDDEVGFLASRFNHAAQQIESLVKARDALLASQKSLLANASHELRSPLTRIRMGLEFLAPSTDATANRAKDEIARNIAELDMLIEEILLASRLEAHQTDLGTVEAVDLVGLCAEACAHFEATLEAPDGTDLTVQGVPKLLRRAVRNLLENAKRYGQGPATVTVRRMGNMASVQICDQGPGVPDFFQERIFEPFFRLPGASERDGGVGLGLALVKSIALRHQGSVHCMNRASGGACFEIRLPLPTNGQN